MSQKEEDKEVINPYMYLAHAGRFKQFYNNLILDDRSLQGLSFFWVVVEY